MKIQKEKLLFSVRKYRTSIVDNNSIGNQLITEKKL